MQSMNNVEDPNTWWKKFDTGFYIDPSIQEDQKNKEQQEKSAILNKMTLQDARIKQLEREVKSLKKKVTLIRLEQKKK